MRLEGALRFLDSHPPNELIVDGVRGVTSAWFDLVSLLLSAYVFSPQRERRMNSSLMFASVSFCVFVDVLILAH